MKNLSETSAYVLITPVKDEDAFIGETLASVVGQSLLLLQWVIVGEGATEQLERMKQGLGLFSRVAPPGMETGRPYSDSA